MPMSMSIVLSSVLILLAIGSYPTAQGLECYSCWDDASEPASVVNGLFFYHVEGHKSCGRGQIPDERFKVTCSPVGEGLGKDDIPICAQVFVEAKNGTGTVQLNARSCVYTNRTIEDLTNITHSCGIRTLDNLHRVTLGDIRDALSEVDDDFPWGTMAQVCHCNSDNCNMSAGINGGGIFTLLAVVIVLLHANFFRG